MPVDWPALFERAGVGRVRPSELPTYPFQHQRYWLESDRDTGDLTAAGLDDAEHPLLRAGLQLGAAHESAVFTGRLSEKTLPWLPDHRVAGVALLPGTALLDALLHIGHRIGAPTVEELTVSVPITVPDGGGTDLQVHIAEADGGRRDVRLLTRTGPGRPWQQNATATLAEDEPGAEPGASWQLPPAEGRPLDLDGFYDRLTVAYGPSFHAVEAVRLGDGRLHAHLRLPDEVPGTDGHGLHPALLDAALHPLAAAAFFADPDAPRLAFSWSGVKLHATGARSLRVLVERTGPDTVSLRGVDETGAPVVEVDALTVRPVDPRALTAQDDARLFDVTWTSAPATTATDTPHWAAYDRITDDAPTPPLVVLHAGVGDPSRSEPDRAHTIGLDVLHALQAWLADERTADSRLAVVVRPAEPAQQTVRGLVRTAQSENPGRFVLVESDGSPDAAGASIAAAVSGLPDEPEIAVRDGQRFVARLRRLEPAAPASPSPLAGGTVLVTGATGGLGRLVTRHLAEAHQVAELVLVTRSGIPADLLADLAALGVQVRAETADVADRDALAAIVHAVEDRLTGVVHVAGIVDDGVIEALDDARWDRVLRPKADAAWHLHELTAGLDLAAFVLYSSASGVLGGAGQGNYAAANAFLDGLAAHRHSLGLPAVSLAWGLWAEAAGMGGRLSDTDLARMARTGTRPLSAEQGLALFDAALTTDRAALVAMRLDVTDVREENLPALLRDLAPAGRTRRAPRRAAADGSAGTPDSLVRRLAALPAADRAETLLTLVRDTAAAVLGHASADGVDARKAFKELGIDSLTAVELRNRLGAATGLRLPATLVFNHPTPTALAAHLATELAIDDTTEDTPATAPATPAADRAGHLDEPIAIVGTGCRFPGDLNSADALWRFLDADGDAIGALPTDRGWDIEGQYDPDPDTVGKTYVRGGGFLTGVAGFDAAFFGINPREALAMDPQQRLLLEVAWETLEGAGLDPSGLHATPTGVFIGTHGQDYGTHGTGGRADEGYLVTGNAGSVLSGRLSYTLGLEGPSVTVDTACSSSLVALHLAAQALRAGECTLALAGGASVMSTLEGLIGFSRQRGLAADGRSKAFADAADGFGMSEGVGLLLLERLSDARRLGHEVLAVVRGSAVNQDGASNGLTAPNGPSQERVVRAALAGARLRPDEVDAVEAHGTGTPLGDPIEAHALMATYGKDRPADRPLWLGSVKSNIGHTQAAAGAAGVIKMVEALRHGRLPRTLHVDAPSSHIDWSAGGVALLTEARDWPDLGRPRRAAVSAFGVSGTNAHVILEAPDDLPQDTADEGRPSDPSGETAGDPATPAGARSASTPLPWVASAASAPALHELAARLAAYADEHPDSDPAGTARALVTGRAALAERAVAVGTDHAGLRDALTAFSRNEPTPQVVSGVADVNGKSVFVFPGQGAQWVGMGRRLL
ncbi:type I polyketide synthase, partial [Streptomyces ziwulingensis]|uniref:type I polyketide synthase n=1 Tax=Streptomyces ziwulingensis TaxID=1045501 RepID=UPI0031E94933